MGIDAAVATEVLRMVSPLALEAAFEAVADRERTSTDRIGQIELALEQARYEAARAHRQYNAVKPENRIVVGELERRWNERLRATNTASSRSRTAMGPRGGSSSGPGKDSM